MAWVSVEVDFDDFDTDDLITELEGRGYEVNKKSNGIDKDIWNLYQTFLTDNGDNNNMDKELRKFFTKYYNKATV
jgi:hypothetical protein